MDVISRLAAERATTPCTCSAPGYCPRHAVKKSQRLWELCRVVIRQFKRWERGAIRQEKREAPQTVAPAAPDPSAAALPERGTPPSAPQGLPDQNGIAGRHSATPERIIIHDGLSPGDITVLTGALKALHDQYPGRFLTDVRTPCPALWENNPRVTPMQDGEGRHINACYDADRAFPQRPVYATINACNERPIHMLEAYCEGLAHALELPRLTPSNWLQPSITLSDDEKRWISQVQEITGKPNRFWIVNSGIKRDYTAKRWNGFQEVVDRTKERVTWVQVGSLEHDHRPMEGVIDLLGKTDLRQLVRLVYHAEGMLCGVTALAHLAHWIERGPASPFRRHAVIIGGGREPPHWFAYPGQHVVHTIGEFDCCAQGGCWKSRVEALPEFPEKNDSLCVHSRGNQGLCMESIRPADVAQLVLTLAGWTSSGPGPNAPVRREDQAPHVLSSDGV